MYGVGCRLYIFGLRVNHLVCEDGAGHVLLVQEQQEIDADHLVRFELPRRGALAGETCDVLGRHERVPSAATAAAAAATAMR